MFATGDGEVTALMLAQGVWSVAFIAFLIATFYRHFCVRPYRPDILFDRGHPDRRAQLTSLAVFVALQVSGFALFV